MRKLFMMQGFLLISGMVCGIIGYAALPDELVLKLGNFLTGQMQNLRAVCSAEEAAGRIARANSVELLRVYLVGLCIVGVPILILLLYVKGFTFGFTGCFLLSHSVLLLVSRLLYVMVFTAAVAAAMRFSWILLQNRMQSLLRQLLQYSAVFLLLFLLILAASYVDGLCCARYLAGFAG